MLTIGSTEALTLDEAIVEYSEARKKVAKARQLQLNGKAPPMELNPAAAKSKQRRDHRGALTMKQLWEKYKLENAPKWRPKTANEYARIMRLHILPQLGDMKVKDVRPPARPCGARESGDEA